MLPKKYSSSIEFIILPQKMRKPTKIKGVCVCDNGSQLFKRFPGLNREYIIYHDIQYLEKKDIAPTDGAQFPPRISFPHPSVPDECAWLR